MVSLTVAIHNKNGKGLLQKQNKLRKNIVSVAIHNKNGKGLLHYCLYPKQQNWNIRSQSTIKMEKGYYFQVCVRILYTNTCRNPQ